MKTGRCDPSRRRWLAGLLAVAVLPALGWCRTLWAAGRPVRAFRAEKMADTIRALYGDLEPVKSEQVRIGMAELAENGAVVPIKVETDLQDVREIAILASRNPVPLLAAFELGPSTRPFVATRVKLAESCDVYALARTGTGVYMAQKSVRVTIGGCGSA